MAQIRLKAQRKQDEHLLAHQPRTPPALAMQAPVPGGGAPADGGRAPAGADALARPAHRRTKSDLEQASVLLGMKLSPVPSPAPSPKRRKLGFPPDDQPAAVSRSGSSDSAELLGVDLVPRKSTAPSKKLKKAEDLPKPPHGCGVREATLAGFARVPDAPAGLVERSARFVSEVACMFPPGSTIFSLFKRFLAAPRTCVDDRKRAVKEIILLLNETPQLMKLFLGLLPPESYVESVRSHDVQSLVRRTGGRAPPEDGDRLLVRWGDEAKGSAPGGYYRCIVSTHPASKEKFVYGRDKPAEWWDEPVSFDVDADDWKPDPQFSGSSAPWSNSANSLYKAP